MSFQEDLFDEPKSHHREVVDKPVENQTVTYTFRCLTAPAMAVSSKGEAYCKLIAKMEEPPFESMQVLAFGAARELLRSIALVDKKLILTGHEKDDKRGKTFFCHSVAAPGDKKPRTVFDPKGEAIAFYGGRAQLKEAIKRDIDYNVGLGRVPIVESPDPTRPEFKIYYWVDRGECVKVGGRFQKKIDFLMDRLGVIYVNEHLRKLTSGGELIVGKGATIQAPWVAAYKEWRDRECRNLLGQVEPEPDNFELFP